MGGVGNRIGRQWRKVKGSPRFRNVLVFLVFVMISTVFWFIMSLNDSVTETFKVSLRIQNVPDSVTFITDPPADFHVTVRDKGTTILRSGVVKSPVLSLDFPDYSKDGVFRFTRTDLNAALKASFGGAVQITSTSLDSLRLYYTTDPGRNVPIVVRADLGAASGFIVSGPARATQKSVKVYAYNASDLDTVTRVYTELFTKRNLSQTTYFNVRIHPIPNVKIVPNTVRVEVPVEALVKKEGYVTVGVDNEPPGESLLLFPNKVPVEYYVPMSLFNSEVVPVSVSVDYLETRATGGNRLSVRIRGVGDNVVNPRLQTDSVEYTIVKK